VVPLGAVLVSSYNETSNNSTTKIEATIVLYGYDRDSRTLAKTLETGVASGDPRISQGSALYGATLTGPTGNASSLLPSLPLLLAVLVGIAFIA